MKILITNYLSIKIQTNNNIKEGKTQELTNKKY